jgi:cytochrome c-type biogenesis protein CcmF
MAFQRDGSTATLRVILEPLVPWIWAGGGLICLAAMFAAWPSRQARVERATVRAAGDRQLPPAPALSGGGARPVAAAQEMAT